MPRLRSILALAALTVGLAVLALVPAAGGVAPKPPAHRGRLVVGVEVLHFANAGRSLRATGVVTATLSDQGGHTTTIHQPVALTASTGGGCRVLHLFLDQLNLQLLGLTAHLDRVNLDITGSPRGGTLGVLFCRLARAKVARVADLRAINAALRPGGGHAVRFTAGLTAQATAAATGRCQVLDLIVGPLNLTLLGLVVDLNRVHLSVIAQRGLGQLGDTFCTLADNNTAG